MVELFDFSPPFNMNVDPPCPQSQPCPEASDSRDSSPTPVICGPEEKYPSLQMSSAEMPHAETVSPLPSSTDVLIQGSPGSSTSPKVKLPASAEKSTVKKEEKVKKQKTRTVFSPTQLCVLSDRFQRQKYLSLQQMQELSSVLNLSYKQVKTWFQNQRMKCKRWQKTNWPKNSNSAAQKGSAPTEYPSLYSSYHQGCLVNTSGNFPLWSNQPWNNPAWSNQTWNSQSWSNHSWNSQTWCTQAWNNQAWNNPFHNCGEECLQPCMQFQQSYASDVESTMQTTGESHNVIQQTTKYFSNTQTMDLFLNYYMNMQPEAV